MSIGKGKSFESVIISLPKKGERTNPGSELVAFSRANKINVLVICNADE